MDFAGDTFPIDWEEYYECYQPPYELKIKGWNDDDTYEHTFDIFVAILPQDVVQPAPQLPGLLLKFLRMVGLG
jgi:hypothetical protein